MFDLNFLKKRWLNILLFFLLILISSIAIYFYFENKTCVKNKQSLGKDVVVSEEVSDNVVYEQIPEEFKNEIGNILDGNINLNEKDRYGADSFHKNYSFIENQEIFLSISVYRKEKNSDHLVNNFINAKIGKVTSGTESGENIEIKHKQLGSRKWRIIHDPARGSNFEFFTYNEEKNYLINIYFMFPSEYFDSPGVKECYQITADNQEECISYSEPYPVEIDFMVKDLEALLALN